MDMRKWPAPPNGPAAARSMARPRRGHPFSGIPAAGSWHKAKIMQQMVKKLSVQTGGKSVLSKHNKIQKERLPFFGTVPNPGEAFPWSRMTNQETQTRRSFMDGIWISGFADEISNDLDEQLSTVRQLGMRYISLRSADGKNVADYTPEEAATALLPRLKAAGVGVSSLGSPIGKIGVDDAGAYEKQLGQLERLCEICKLLDCRYIRVFSFFIPEGRDPEAYRDTVLEKLRGFESVARKHGVILLHENEKDIYGDTADRCLTLLKETGGPCLRAAFDFANFVQCGEDPVRAWDMLHEYVAYIHIKDAVSGSNENVVCGTGEGHIPELLQRAIRDEGYRGFLTLEPHLVLFDALQSLEQKAAADVIKENKAKDGADGYRMQYEALQGILSRI